MSIIEDLQKLSRQLCQSAFKEPSPEIVNFTIKEIWDLLLVAHGDSIISLTDEMIEKMTRVFTNMLPIMKTQTNVVVCIEVKHEDQESEFVQEVKSVSLLDYFDLIDGINCHNETYKDEKYVCSYHQEDLFTHLHLVCLITMAYKLDHEKNVNDQDLLATGLTAYLHDIGKPGCMNRIPKKKWLSYPFHGELGAGLLGRIWAPEFAKCGIDKSLWELMCRTVAVHMCGYHSHDVGAPETEYKWDLLCSEHPYVKNTLHYLSFGDYFGGIKEDDLSETPLFLQSRPDFKTHLEKAFNPKFMLKYNFQGTAILMRGSSGSGKSTCVKSLRNTLTAHNISYSYIERDAIMCSLVRKHLNEEDTCEKANGDEYKRLYKVYDENRKKLSPLVNNTLKNLILDGLIDSRVVIIDTLMTYYRGIEQFLTKKMKNIFVISIDVVRNTSITEKDSERLGVNVQSQLKISQDKTLLSWLSTSVLKGDLNMIASCSTARKMDVISHLSRPRICFVVCWNEHGQVGYDEMFVRTVQFCQMRKCEFVNEQNLSKKENNKQKYLQK